jgi:steroid 5-alpha reductase family enzyme
MNRKFLFSHRNKKLITMWKTVLFLLFTLLVVPVVTFYFDEPLNDLQMRTLKVLLWTYGIAATLTFIVSSITDNYSQVDKLWSIIPVPYVWIIAHFSDYDQRMVLMAILVTIWAARLTYNFGRRGGYSLKFWEGEEDYRWSILRAKPEFQAKWRWISFNLFFISGYQMGLILLFTLPALKAMDSAEPLGGFDYFLALLFLFLVLIEFIADQQQYDFQEAKYKAKREGQKLTAAQQIGFTHTGLWAYMRHPNYAAEQGIWIVFYFFSVAATGLWVNWSIAGALLLVLLFKGSSDFSESVSAEKYPLFKKYQEQVGRFLPIKGRFKG